MGSIMKRLPPVWVSNPTPTPPTTGPAVPPPAGPPPDTTAPTITSAATASNPENTTLAHNLLANEPVTWSIVGGADQARFELSANVLRWLSNGTKDFEAPNDSDTNNTYVVTVQALDAAGNISTQNITVTVTDQSEGGSGLVAINNEAANWIGPALTEADARTVATRYNTMLNFRTSDRKNNFAWLTDSPTGSYYEYASECMIATLGGAAADNRVDALFVLDDWCATYRNSGDPPGFISQEQRRMGYDLAIADITGAANATVYRELMAKTGWWANRRIITTTEATNPSTQYFSSRVMAKDWQAVQAAIKRGVTSSPAGVNFVTARTTVKNAFINIMLPSGGFPTDPGAQTTTKFFQYGMLLRCALMDLRDNPSDTALYNAIIKGMRFGRRCLWQGGSNLSHPYFDKVYVGDDDWRGPHPPLNGLWTWCLGELYRITGNEWWRTWMRAFVDTMNADADHGNTTQVQVKAWMEINGAGGSAQHLAYFDQCTPAVSFSGARCTVRPTMSGTFSGNNIITVNPGTWAGQSVDHFSYRLMSMRDNNTSGQGGMLEHTLADPNSNLIPLASHSLTSRRIWVAVEPRDASNNIIGEPDITTWSVTVT